MKNRHPHVFGDIRISSEEEILRNWEKIKQKEKNHRDKNPMDSIPKSLPPLIRRIESIPRQRKWDLPGLQIEIKKIAC